MQPMLVAGRRPTGLRQWGQIIAAGTGVSADLAGRHFRLAGSNGDQRLAHDLGIGAGLPKPQQFLMGEAARRTEIGIVQGHFTFADIDQHGIMAGGRHIGVKAVVQDDADPGVPAKPQSEQRVACLDGHGVKAALKASLTIK